MKMVGRDGRMTKLQERRKAVGITQQQLADASEVNVTMIQKYERGFKDINRAAVISVKAMADALGCAIEDLIED